MTKTSRRLATIPTKIFNLTYTTIRTYVFTVLSSVEYNYVIKPLIYITSILEIIYFDRYIYIVVLCGFLLIDYHRTIKNIWNGKASIYYAHIITFSSITPLILSVHYIKSHPSPSIELRASAWGVIIGGFVLFLLVPLYVEDHFVSKVFTRKATPPDSVQPIDNMPLATEIESQTKVKFTNDCIIVHLSPTTTQSKGIIQSYTDKTEFLACFANPDQRQISGRCVVCQEENIKLPANFFNCVTYTQSKLPSVIQTNRTQANVCTSCREQVIRKLVDSEESQLRAEDVVTQKV